MRYKLYLFFNLASLSGVRSFGNKSRTDLYPWDILIKAKDEFEAAELLNQVMAAGRGDQWFLHYYRARNGTIIEVTGREKFEKVCEHFDTCLMYRVSGTSESRFQYLLI